MPSSGYRDSAHLYHLDTETTQTAGVMSVCPHSDAVAVTHGDPYRHGDGTDAATHVQQGETKTLTKGPGGSAGEAGTAPEGQAAWKQTTTKHSLFTLK